MQNFFQTFLFPSLLAANTLAQMAFAPTSTFSSQKPQILGPGDTVLLTRPDSVRFCVGKFVRLVGPCVTVAERPTTSFLNLFKSYNHLDTSQVSLPIFQNHRHKFPISLTDAYKGKTLEIIGMPKSDEAVNREGIRYRRISIVLQDPTQIRIIKP
jgi:hypothetical protein